MQLLTQIFILLFFCTQIVDSRLLGIHWSDGSEPGEEHHHKNRTMSKKDEDYCHINKAYTQQEKCSYVKANVEKCEGGGYITWTTFVMCELDKADRILIIIGSIIYLLVLFIMISSAADDFFSPNVAGIVAHLGVSESIAGVTFMAFGNGSPDIFGSIASVLSSPKPKAGFAVGELLGGGCFVTLMVTATIVLTQPFKAAKFETLRDLSFYIVAIGWVLFVFLYDNTVHLFQPIAFLAFYAVYVSTVIFSHFLNKRRKEKRRASRHSSKVGSKLGSFPRTRTVTYAGSDKTIPEIQIISAAVEKLNVNECAGNGSGRFAELYSKTPPVSYSNPVSVIEEECSSSSEEEEEMLWVGHHLVSGSANRSRAQSIVPPTPISDVRSLVNDVYNHLRPLAENEWEEANVFAKALDVIKIPIIFIFKLTIPLCENSWSKPVAILHTLFAPQFFIFAIQEYTAEVIPGGPGLYVYMFGLSAILIILIIFFTRIRNEPRFYKQAASYAGFLMSISWIYLIASEVVNVVTMLGVISQLSHEVLGLTILAWSNSIGDLIADVAVVKQGYPNMALAAAIGGPLFNLLIGFGLPFTIARLKGTTVEIRFSSVNHLLIVFLWFSLIFTFVACFVQKFHLRRIYAFCLIAIYAGFIAMVVLAESKVFTWGTDE